MSLYKEKYHLTEKVNIIWLLIQRAARETFIFKLLFLFQPFLSNFLSNFEDQNTQIEENLTEISRKKINLEVREREEICLDNELWKLNGTVVKVSEKGSEKEALNTREEKGILLGLGVEISAQDTDFVWT